MPCSSLRCTCRCHRPDPIAGLHDSLGSGDTLKQWVERTGAPRCLNSRLKAAAVCHQVLPVALVRTHGLKAPQPRCLRWPLACGLPSARLGLGGLYSFSKLPVEPDWRWYAEAADQIPYPMWRKRSSLVGQLLPAPRLNAFLFDAPRRTGTVLGVVAAKPLYPVVAVLDMRLVLKGSLLSNLLSFLEFPGRQTGFSFLHS